jgi:beta-lactamase class A
VYVLFSPASVALADIALIQISAIAALHRSDPEHADNGVAHATNDIGLIALPDGRQLAIAVFVTDSTADEATRKKVIARIGRAAYDAATRNQ